MNKEYRMKKLFNKSGKLFLVAIDHGFTQGPISGIDNIREDLRDIVMAKPDGIIIHKGLIRYLDLGLCAENNVSIIVHLMGSTSISVSPNDKRVVCSVEEAVKLGADAVSVHVNVGAETENDMLEKVAQISYDCEKWNMPVLGMFYPRGVQVNDDKDVNLVEHVTRIAMELNMDIVKTNYTGKENFAQVANKTEIPLLIAGGDNVCDEEFLYKIKEAMDRGGSGVAVGRNVFQNPHRKEVIKAISNIVHNDMPVEEALKFIYK